MISNHLILTELSSYWKSVIDHIPIKLSLNLDQYPRNYDTKDDEPGYEMLMLSSIWNEKGLLAGQHTDACETQRSVY